jgi:hypothetical protein
MTRILYVLGKKCRCELDHMKGECPFFQRGNAVCTQLQSNQDWVARANSSAEILEAFY